MRMPLVFGIAIGLVACGAVTEDPAPEGSAVDAPSKNLPATPSAEGNEKKAERTPNPGERAESVPLPNAGEAAPSLRCTETILDANESCLPAHQHLAKALDLCFTTGGDLAGFDADERCSGVAGFKRAKVACCYGPVVTTKPASLPLVPVSTTAGGGGGSSTSSSCPGVALVGSEYAATKAASCAAIGHELVGLHVADRCADGTSRTVGETCAALTSAP